MSKQTPTIQKFMTTQPHTIDANEAVESAQSTMSQLKIHHLPVVDYDQLVGVLSERDVKVATSLYGANTRNMHVRDVCQHSLLEVGPETPLEEIAAEMAQKHIDCAIVTQNKKVVGIFTVMDACRALKEILQSRFHEHHG